MAAEAACAFAAVTPTESVLPPEKIPLIVLAPAEILLMSMTGRITGVVSISSDKTVEGFASVFLVESKASPATPSAARLTIWEYPSKPFTRPISMNLAIIKARNRENLCFLRWIWRALRDRQNQSQGLDLATNFADGKGSSQSMLSRRSTRLPALSTSCASPHPGGGAFAVLAVF